jgi:hypothetical protein
MIAWAQRPGAFAYNSVFPQVPVSRKSDSYFVWDRADFFRDMALEMGPGAAAPVGVKRLSTDSYNCTVYGYAENIADQERANADAPLDLDRAAARSVSHKLMLRMEKKWVTDFFSTGVWTGSTTGADLVGGVDFTQFAAPSTGTPVSTVREQIFNLMKLGVDPSGMTLTVGAEVFQVLLDHNDFLERYEQVQAAILNEQLMAAVLGVGQVVVPKSVENTAAEGATPTQAFVHGDNMLLSWAPQTASIDEPSAGYTYVWSGLTGSANAGMRILRFRDDMHHSDHVEGQIACDPKATAPELGVFFSDCIA